MGLNHPIAESHVTITSVNVGRDETALRHERNIGTYGPASVTQHLTPSEDSRDSRQFEGTQGSILPQRARRHEVAGQCTGETIGCPDYPLRQAELELIESGVCGS